VAPLSKFIGKATRKLNSDWHYRKFFTREHVLSQVYFQVSDEASLRGLAQALNEDSRVKEIVDNKGVDLSSLSRANSHRTYQVFEFLFESLFPISLACCGQDLGPLATLGPLRIVDGTFMQCVASMVWASYQEKKNGVKGHLLLSAGDDLPERLVLTEGKGSERAVWKQLLQRGVTYIIDRGYNCYGLFNTVAVKGAFFVTRLLTGAAFEVVQELPVDEEDRSKGVLSDRKIRLGKGKKAVKVLLRLVTFQAGDGKVYRFLTNRMDLRALLVCELYHRRWEIELFFRFMKNYLKVKQFLGRSENAVLIQLYAALIAFLLLRLYAKIKEGSNKLTLQILRAAKHRLFARIPHHEITEYLARLQPG